MVLFTPKKIVLYGESEQGVFAAFAIPVGQQYTKQAILNILECNCLQL